MLSRFMGLGSAASAGGRLSVMGASRVAPAQAMAVRFSSSSSPPSSLNQPSKLALQPEQGLSPIDPAATTLSRSALPFVHAPGTTTPLALADAVAMNQYVRSQDIPETMVERVKRWADVTGFYTRYNDRKSFMLDTDSSSRLNIVMMLEFERKLYMWMSWHTYAGLTVLLVFLTDFGLHIAAKPPGPRHNYGGIGHKPDSQLDSSWCQNLFFKTPKGRCKHCSPLDGPCKKECFDELREKGHSFFFKNALSKTRETLQPSHFK